MKRIFIALTLFALAGICLASFNQSIHRHKQELLNLQSTWQAQTQQLAALQAEIASVRSEVEPMRSLPTATSKAAVDSELADFLLTKDIKSASPELQDRILEKIGRSEKAFGDYVLVSKAALTWSVVKPLKAFPADTKLGDATCGVLAITAGEKQAVESAFAGAFDSLRTWAGENVRRDGPAGDQLAQYTIPEDRAFADAWSSNLFFAINSAVGEERGEILHKDFEHFRVSEDGAVGDRTNILAIYRMNVAPGFGSRSGWIWSDGSVAVNTRPEPIKPGKFPPAFRFIFPGGWMDLAAHEGLQLPDEFKEQ